MSDTHKVTDAMNQAWQGDQVAKAEFFAMIGDRLVKLIRDARWKFPGAKRDAETSDNVHEVWMRIVESKLGNAMIYENREHFYRACYVCACNLLKDRLKRKEKKLGLALLDEQKHRDEVIESTSGPSTKADRYVAYGDVALAVSNLAETGELSEREAALFGHIYVAEMSQTEAFRELGIAESSGREMLNRVHAKIGAFLRREDERKRAIT
jgi:DNA-directed RNA polymerase specialized sigma24 family protein